MRTVQFAVEDDTYTIAPLNFSQYEQLFQDGKIVSFSEVAKFSLANASVPGNPPFDEIPAGHVIKLFHEILRISGLTQPGETKVPETAG